MTGYIVICFGCLMMIDLYRMGDTLFRHLDALPDTFWIIDTIRPLIVYREEMILQIRREI